MAAPIVLFVYNRLTHTQLTVAALQKNLLAADTELYIFSDASKTAADDENVRAVRKYLRTIEGFKTITITERDKNFGLANNIIDGVTGIVNRFGEIIVLEDDLVTSPYFLQYMNQALETYRHNEKVISIHGYVYPVKEKLPDTFFLRGADCWGWATWKRGWDLFEPDGKKLMEQLVRNKLTREFDYDGAYHFTLQLSHQVKGINNSWAVRWHASAYIKDKLTLYPGRSLVHNIGNDGSGMHSWSSTIYDVTLSAAPVPVMPIPAVVNTEGRNAFVQFFRSVKPGALTWAFIKFKIFVKNVIFKRSKTPV
jgi:hypothetical protein